MPQAKIQELLAEPFGPYPDVEILSGALRKGTILNLASLSMECQNAPIGFDESEYIGTPPPGHRIIRHAVLFYGILEIESLDWLSPQGTKWLDYDLRKRASMGAEVNHGAHGFRLTGLYGDGKRGKFRIRVWIQGEKNMQARFLTGGQPESLILQSKRESDQRSYTYNILSLHAEMLGRSRNFLQRYLLWALIDDIIKTDPYGTPIKNRTIDWLVNNYMKRSRQEERYRQVIFDPLYNVEVDTEGTTTKRRHLRHIPRSDIFGIFGAHADWLLAQHLASHAASVQKLDVRKLYRFCLDARKGRKATNRYNIRWGLPYGINHDDGKLDLCRFGHSPEYWVKRITAALKPKKQKTISNPKSIGLEKSHLTKPTRQLLAKIVYDSDFSETSTAPASDSDDYQGAISQNTPFFCFHPPAIPAGRFEWTCPGCDYRIDLLEIAAGNSGITWKYRDEDDVQEYLKNMVSDHYLARHVQLQGKQIAIPAVKVESVD